MRKPKLVQRACCWSGATRRRGYVAPSDALDLASTNGPVIAQIEEAAIDRSTCIHESATPPSLTVSPLGSHQHQLYHPHG